MWVEKQENGNFKYVERFKDPLTEKWRRVSTTLTKDSPQAHNKAKAILGDRIKEILERQEDIEAVTMTELTDLWLNFIQGTSLKPNTKRAYQDRMNMVNRYVGEVLVENVTAVQLNKVFLAMLSKEGKSYTTVLNRYKCCKQVFEFAMEYGYLESNSFFKKVSVPKINVKDKDEDIDKYLEPEEVTKLFKALRDDEEYDILYLFTIMLCTGVRYSEANAIHLEQINFDNQTIYIDRQWDRNEREFILPKNGEKRMVTYNRQLAHTLLEVLERRPAMLEAYEVDTDLLIFNDKGGPLDISIANNRLHTYEPQDKSYTTHIFRHTYVTRMVENYVPGKLIAKQVGHADTGLIDKIYGHFSQKMDNDLKQAVSKVTF